MYESSLASLAILKVNWDISGKDFIESFVPFAIECVRKSVDEVVSLPSLQKQLKTEFGLDIPFNPLKIEAIHDDILRKLIEYAKSDHSVDWTGEDADAALHRFLRDNSLSLLFTYAENGIFSGPSDHSGPTFIVGSFITKAQSKDKETFENIVTLVQGNLLVNALYLPEPGRVKQRFRNTRVYLDTSIISYAAGHAGPTCAAPSLELISLLGEHGAELYCFQQTRNELRVILDTCAGRLRSGRVRDSFGPSMEYFIETGRTASDVELMAARLNVKLRSLGITVDEKPPYEKEYLVDEKGFEAAIETEIRYTSSSAREHDVDSISAIARLRRGRESYSSESSWALFITTNFPLARVTRQFFQHDASPGTVALCMTDYALGNLLWLKNPTEAPDLPRKQLLAHAFAAMQPPDYLWKRYLAETARLQDEGIISADDYYVLRHSLVAKSALMDLTQGNDTAFSEGTIQEVLIVAKEKIRADLEEVVKREQESLRTAESRIQKYEDEEALRITKLHSKASNWARQVRRAILVIGTIIIIISIGYTFPWHCHSRWMH